MPVNKDKESFSLSLKKPTCLEKEDNVRNDLSKAYTTKTSTKIKIPYISCLKKVSLKNRTNAPCVGGRQYSGASVLNLRELKLKETY